MQRPRTSLAERLRPVIDIVLDEIIAEKIFLLPARTISGQKPLPEKLADYHLLILSREREAFNKAALERRIEKACLFKAIVHVIIQDVHHFNACLREQPYFYPELSHSTLIYDYGHVPIASRPEMDITLIQRSLRQSFRFFYNQAEQLLSGVVVERMKGQMNLPAIAAGTRHIYTAAEIVYTGHDPATCDLLRLRRSTARFSGDLALLFPFHSLKEKYLLTCLNKLSISKRSKEKHLMSWLVYEGAIKRLEDLLMVTTFECQHHINGMDKRTESWAGRT